MQSVKFTKKTKSRLQNYSTLARHIRRAAMNTEDLPYCHEQRPIVQGVGTIDQRVHAGVRNGHDEE